jgi:hypothetical protein
MAAVEVSVVALEQSGIVPAAGGTCVGGRKEKKVCGPEGLAHQTLSLFPQ